MTSTIQLTKAELSSAPPLDASRICVVVAGHLATFECVANDERLGSLYTLDLQALPLQSIDREGC